MIFLVCSSEKIKYLKFIFFFLSMILDTFQYCFDFQQEIQDLQNFWHLPVSLKSADQQHPEQ